VFFSFIQTIQNLKKSRILLILVRFVYQIKRSKFNYNHMYFKTILSILNTGVIFTTFQLNINVKTNWRYA